MREFEILVYGSYGYTGKLIVDECRKLNLKVLLSGRDADKLKSQSEGTHYPFEAVSMDQPEALRKVVSKAQVVIHCAGPFKQTARQMAEACLETQTHYTDITGEFEVFEMLAGLDQQARQKGIIIMPGTGFDVVPTDCLAVHLKNRLPTATHLQLAFAMTKGGVSRGTARTMIEGMGHGGMIRQNGKLIPIALGDKVLRVDFGPFTRNTLCIPWGDIATAWRSTGIPNIEVYTAVPDRTITMARVTKYFNWLLRTRWIKNFLRSKVDARPAGPDQELRQQASMYLYGTAWNGDTVVKAQMKTSNGYVLTASAATLIAKRLLTPGNRSGYFTPAQYFGENLILEVPGTELHPL